MNPGGLMVDVGMSVSEMGVDNSGGEECVEMGDVLQYAYGIQVMERVLVTHR